MAVLPHTTYHSQIYIADFYFNFIWRSHQQRTAQPMIKQQQTTFNGKFTFMGQNDYNEQIYR